MPKTIGKNLNLCFTRIKEYQEDHSRPILPPNSTTTTTTTSSFLIKNFNTLYDPAASDNSPSNSKSSVDISSSESDLETSTPDFATVIASNRFFFSSPGRSNSIIESSSSVSSSSMSSPPPAAISKINETETVIGGSVAIPTFSPDPYMDFRRSMQEMVESRDLVDVRANWDYLHELLMCYLALNPKSTHKFIITAFADLLLTLMPSPSDGGPR